MGRILKKKEETVKAKREKRAGEKGERGRVKGWLKSEGPVNLCPLPLFHAFSG